MSRRRISQTRQPIARDRGVRNTSRQLQSSYDVWKKCTLAGWAFNEQRPSTTIPLHHFGEKMRTERPSFLTFPSFAFPTGRST